MTFIEKDKGEVCENCGFRSHLVERQGYMVCPLCVDWLDWEPGRVLKVVRDHERYDTV